MKQLYLLFILVFCISVPVFSVVPEDLDEPVEHERITVNDLIQRMDKVDPDIAAAKFKVIAAKKAAEKTKSAYFPKVELQSLLTAPGGLPGSYGDLGVSGVMVSPFHSGQSLGILGSYTLFDFGRRKNAVIAAEREEDTQREDAKITRINSIQRALQIYYDCIKYNSLVEIWKEKEQRINFLQREVSTFVSTGQRSVVDGYLVKSHLKQVETEVMVFQNESLKANETLGVLLDLPKEKISFVGLDDLKAPNINGEINIYSSPFMKRAESDLLTSKAEVDLAKSENMPQIKTNGTIGDYTSARLVPKQNWSFGVGITMPVFEGFRIQKGIEEARAKSSQKQKELEATRKNIQETNIKLDQALITAKEKLEHLETELKIAREGYQVAFVRYARFQGGLIDLRETITNLYRVKSELIQTKVELNLYQNVKFLVNGIL